MLRPLVLFGFEAYDRLSISDCQGCVFTGIFTRPALLEPLGKILDVLSLVLSSLTILKDISILQKEKTASTDWVRYIMLFSAFETAQRTYHGLEIFGLIISINMS
jgi:hypothetical protein